MWFLFILIFLVVIDILDIAILPLIFLVLLNVFLKDRKFYLFAFAFISGLILDVLLLRPLGATSLFFVVFTFIMLLYGRKFEIQSLPFIFITAFLGELTYLFIFNYGQIIIQAILASVITLLFWKLIQRLQLI